jgi:DNA-binding NtrC family response regulator
LLGEVGCEQDQVAKQIHDQSLRAKQPFITFNARSLTEEQIELELWGAEKGSVAYLQQTKIGLFEAAHQGTLFIEGIDQCSSKIQSKFYHFFKYGEIRRLGSLYSKPINVRLIASTQVSLDELCEQGLFSRDLYYYFTVAQYRLQPLRKQKAIIPQLCQDLITDFNQIHHKKIRFISQEALLALQHYEWPGNQSELFHIIEGAVIHCSGEGIELQHLPQHFFQVVTQQPPSASQHEIPIRLGTPLKDVEDILIQKTLEATQGDKVMAAHLLGVHIRTIYRWLENRLENRPENQPENQLENQSNSIARSTTSP